MICDDDSDFEETRGHVTNENIPRLRPGLDIFPSPIEESPGLILRDPFRYTQDILLIPAGWVPALALLDGKRSELELQTFLTRQNGGRLVLREDIRRFVDALRSRGFLDSREFLALREARHASFREASDRPATHAGTAYPPEREELSRHLRELFRIAPLGTPSLQNHILGVAAPHVSPSGGVESYSAAYRRLGPHHADRTFVILGTSHYGTPEKFGLTRKPYVTPLGRADVDVALLERLARKAGDAVIMEDYCHAIEHSIEFQVVFLQQAVAPNIKILPILCGALFESFETGQQPDANRNVAALINALAELEASEHGKLFWVLGVDMAHIGARYGDGIAAVAGEGKMRDVSAQDNARLERLCAGDTEGFVRLVQANRDELKWCGYSPFYVFLSAMGRVHPELRGRLLRYDQWNIDPQSVVSFGALEFFNGAAPKTDVTSIL
jgi:AmmeMemoRadiSam system protein B